MEARAATSSGSFTRDEIRALVRSAVDEAVTPLQHVLRDLEQRLADLEQRPRANSRPGFEGTMASTPAALAVQIAAAQAALPVAAAAPAPAVSPAAPSAPASAPHYASAMAPPASMAHVPAALAPRIDLAAIERNVKLDDADLAMIDGRRRKRRNALLLVFFLVLVFGGMFAMLARSYMHID